MSKTDKFRAIFLYGLTSTCFAFIVFVNGVSIQADEFQSQWEKQFDGVWIGPDYWANRLQDWQISDGRLECIETRANKPMRTVHLLTGFLNEKPGTLDMRVRINLLGDAPELSLNTWAGFLLGAGGEELEYRAAALVHHFPGQGGGLIVAVDGTGQVVLRDNNVFRGYQNLYPEIVSQSHEGEPAALGSMPEVELAMTVEPRGEAYALTLIAYDPASKKILSRALYENIQPEHLIGNVALVSHPGTKEEQIAYGFRDWRISGSKFKRDPNRKLGPIICTQYTLNENVLKMTAQLAPIAEGDSQNVHLEIEEKGGWKRIDSQKVVVPSYTATFRVIDWDSNQDTRYRVSYSLQDKSEETLDYWQGTVRAEPKEKREFVIAAFTGNNNCGYGADSQMKGLGALKRWTMDNIWFPHNDIVDAVEKHRPDFLFFSGDQVYEGRSPTNAERAPEDKARLDYLYKWYLWCWAFGDLARNLPTICLPDDHDVYQGNIWGAGGELSPDKNANSGGYVMSPEFVNMVQRTQTSHFPDPYDPTPVKNGIEVYYTGLTYGGVSFAILEDRKFKSSPTIVDDAKIEDGHILTLDYDTLRADKPGATLYGERQLQFLEDWSADWKDAYVKVALSQTILANLQTREMYPDHLDRDLDSNGWPQSGRKRVLEVLRKGFAFMLAGDQHLGSVIQHGADTWNDSGFSFCVPSIANFYPRSWRPLQPGKNHRPGMPEYTGEYLDGLQNKITVYAASNPEKADNLPLEEDAPSGFALHGKAPGYGIVRIDKAERTIAIECWPRNANPSRPEQQYPGWPMTIHQYDNYGREATAWLPEIHVQGVENPVVQVIQEETGEVVYTLRIQGSTFQPKVFAPGAYTLRVGEPGAERVLVRENVQSVQKPQGRLVISF